MPNPIKDTIIFHRFTVMQVLYLILILTLISCNPKTQTYVVTFDHVNGLEEGSPVILHGHKIGEVKNIAITDTYKIHVEIILSDTLALPKDSKFKIASLDLFTKAIDVTPGESKVQLTGADRIVGQPMEEISLDRLIEVLKDEIDEAKRRVD